MRSGSEGQLLIPIARAWAQSGGTASAMNAPGQDEQGMMEVAVVESRRPAEDLVDDRVGRFEFFQDSREAAP